MRWGCGLFRMRSRSDAHFDHSAVFAIEQGSWAWFLWRHLLSLDLADGILARKLRQTSEVGRVLDICGG